MEDFLPCVGSISVLLRFRENFASPHMCFIRCSCISTTAVLDVLGSLSGLFHFQIIWPCSWLFTSRFSADSSLILLYKASWANLAVFCFVSHFIQLFRHIVFAVSSLLSARWPTYVLYFLNVVSWALAVRLAFQLKKKELHKLARFLRGIQSYL